MVASLRYPEVAQNNTLNLDSLRTFQSMTDSNFSALDSRLRQIEAAVTEMSTTIRWIQLHHPEAMREYHASQLAIYALEEPPTPAP